MCSDDFQREKQVSGIPGCEANLRDRHLAIIPREACPHDVLTQCVGDAEAFKSEFWGKHTYLYRSEVSWNELISWSDIDRILTSSSSLRASNVRLLKGGKAIPIGEFISSQRTTRRFNGVFNSDAIISLLTDGTADTGAVLGQMAGGVSMVVQGAHRLHGPLAEMLRKIELELSHRCQMNIYITPPDAQALEAHTDPHHVFIIQVSGSKEWEFGPTPFEQNEGTGDSVRKMVLKTGDVFYLPTGTRHRVRSLNEWSVHITIGVSAHTMRSVLRGEIERMLGMADPVLDQDLPIGWLRDTSRAELEKCAQLARDIMGERIAEISAAHVIDATAFSFLTERRRATAGALVDLVKLQSLTADTLLEKRTGAPFVLWPDSSGDRAKLLLGDHAFEIRQYLVGSIRTIAGFGRFIPRDLVPVLPREDECVALCESLIHEGALVFVD